MQRRTEASGRRRYTSGDTVKLRVVVDRKPHFKEVRLVFAHESDEHTMIMATVEPPSGLDIAADGSMRSCLDADITIPRGRPSGSTGSTGSATRRQAVGWDTSPQERAYPRRCCWPSK